MTKLSNAEFLARLRHDADPEPADIIAEQADEIAECRQEIAELIKERREFTAEIFRLDRELAAAKRPTCAVCGRVQSKWGTQKPDKCAHKRWSECTRLPTKENEE